MVETNDKKIISLRFSHDPPVYELSEDGRFQITFEFFRASSSDDDRRPLTFLAAGSVFDVPFALSQGLLEVVDLETGTRVEIPTRDAPGVAESPNSEQNSDPENSSYTLTAYDASIPKHIRNILHTYTLPSPQSPGAWPLEAGKKYAFRLTSTDLGVKWWNYGTETNLDLPSQPERLSRVCISASNFLCRHGLPAVQFLVVPPLPHPPSLTIKLSVSAPVFDRNNPVPISVRISTTNRGNRPIIAKNRFDQPYGDGLRYPVTVLSTDRPDWRNLSIVDVASGTGLTDATSPICVPHVGVKGFVRREFTTLEPGVPFESEIVVLPENSHGRLKRLAGNELRITLRPYEVWWNWGTVDEVFEGKTRFGPNLGGYKPPLRLESSDELTLHIVGKREDLVDKRDVEVIGGLEVTVNPSEEGETGGVRGSPYKLWQ